MNQRDDILQIAGRMVKYARVVRSRVNHGAAIFGEVDVNCEAASEGGKQTGQPVRFMQWYGFRVLPPLKAQTVVLAPRGAAAQALVVAAEQPAEGPTDLEEAEPVIFDRAGSVLRFKADGSWLLTAAGGGQVELTADGKILLTSKGGATFELDSADKLLTADELLLSRHFGGAGDEPTVTAPAGGGALGAAGQVITAATEGTDTAFTFTVQTDTVNPPPGAGEVAKVTFAKRYKRAPLGVTVSPANADAGLAAPSGPGGSWWAESTETGLTISTGATLQQSTTYKLFVTVIQ